MTGSVVVVPRSAVNEWRPYIEQVVPETLVIGLRAFMLKTQAAAENLDPMPTTSVSRALGELCSMGLYEVVPTEADDSGFGIRRLKND